MKYIDADNLITEIKRYKNKADERLKIKGRTFGEEQKDLALQNLCGNLLHFIDSLRQEQSIEKDSLTWQDINELERIINNVHYEFRNGIGEESFGKLVLERFNEGKDAPRPEIDLEKFTEAMDAWRARYNLPDNITIKATMAFTARMFYMYPDVAREWYDNLPKATMD